MEQLIAGLLRTYPCSIVGTFDTELRLLLMGGYLVTRKGETLYKGNSEHEAVEQFMLSEELHKWSDK